MTIFYDNACQLHDYVLSRESGFFSNSQMFLDVFHSWSHKCPAVYRSQRLVGFDSNTQICEQINSFLQPLKRSSYQMSQSTFTFILQYFIHVWNVLKKEKLERQEKVALNPLLTPR